LQLAAVTGATDSRQSIAEFDEHTRKPESFSWREDRGGSWRGQSDAETSAGFQKHPVLQQALKLSFRTVMYARIILFGIILRFFASVLAIN